VLHGTILKETVAPLTYNSATQQSSSFLITVVVSVTLTRARRQSSLREQELRLSPAVSIHHESAKTSSRKALRPWKGSRGSLRGSWWPMCWKGFRTVVSDQWSVISGQ